MFDKEKRAGESVSRLTWIGHKLVPSDDDAFGIHDGKQRRRQRRSTRLRACELLLEIFDVGVDLLDSCRDPNARPLLALLGTIAHGSVVAAQAGLGLRLLRSHQVIQGIIGGRLDAKLVFEPGRLCGLSPRLFLVPVLGVLGVHAAVDLGVGGLDSVLVARIVMRQDRQEGVFFDGLHPSR